MKRLLLPVLVLAFLFAPEISKSDELYEARLNSGIRNSDAYSYLLIKQSHENGAEAVKTLQKALSYSPDLPAVYFELSKASFSFSGLGLLNCIDYAVQGIDSYARNFWWSFTLAESLFFGLVISFIFSIALLILIRLFTDISLISHDIGESRERALLLVGLLVLSVLSPFLFLSGLLILLGMYMRKIDRAVVYFFLLVLLFSPLLFKAASLFINASESGSVKAVVQVNESKDNNYALSTLNNSDDYTALFSYALALKREGYYDKAIALYSVLLQKRPDPRIYLDLGNCYVGLYNFSEDRKYNLVEAMKYYQAAVDIRPIASTYYNMSQVSREMFDFYHGNEYFQRALALDRVSVSNYAVLAGRNPNRFVVDEPLSFSELKDYIAARTGKISSLGVTLVPPSVLPFLSLFLMAGFYTLNKNSRDRAYRCRKCNSVLCRKCEKRLMWGQMCPRCYGSLVKLDELDVKERVARLLSIYEQQRKRRTILKILSFIIPGSPHIYAGRVLYGFIFLWPFLFLLLLPVINSIFVRNAYSSHDFFNCAALFGAAVLYLISNFTTRKRISRGWL